MEIFKNSFDGGLNTNISERLVPQNKYIQAANVNIASDGNFFALENIKGTTAVKEILGDGTYEVLAVFSNRYTIGTSTQVPCLTIITAVDSEDSVQYDNTLKIWCYNPATTALYELYEQTIDPTTYIQDDRVIDGVLYPEAGVDILYFTDNFYKIRKLRCEIPVSYSANFLDPLDIQMQRSGALGLVELTSIEEGGSLFCGSYQIAYQLINPDKDQYTKFSLFCNPIQIFLKPKDAFEKSVRSGIGLESNYKIVANINLSETEAAYYTHFRLAVLENIEPSGVNVETVQLTAIELMSDFLSGTTLEDVEYNANIRLESINLADIVVDLMALDYVKTITVRENRLLAGNIHYKTLDYDNGTPAIGGGEVIKAVAADTKNSFSDAFFASTKRGHFRDEVYRYAISYFDEDLNFSYPRVLDLSTITHNRFGQAGPSVIPTNPELFNDPTFLGGIGVYWLTTDYEGDFIMNPDWSGPGTGGVSVTFTGGLEYSNYVRQAITLDNTLNYNYDLVLSHTFSGTSWNLYMSFWNNSTKLSEVIISGAALTAVGTVAPPASTTHVGFRVESITGPGVFTIESASIKQVEDYALPVPPVTVSGFDIKYPGRDIYSSGESFTLFGEDGKIQSLGLRLEDIDNHPTWAKGFIILRANRIKNIQFQTPIIPLKSVFGPGALEEYPQKSLELSAGSWRNVEYPSAQPMGPYTTYVPRNYLLNLPQDIIQYATPAGFLDGGNNRKFSGEAMYYKNANFSLGMIFPPKFMYENEAFLFNPLYRTETIDAALIDTYHTTFSSYGTGSWSFFPIGADVLGRNIKTSIVSSFYALSNERYYYNSGHLGAKTILDRDSNLADYTEFINSAEAGTVAGFSVFNYDHLETPGIFWGTKPNVQKCAVVKFDSSKTEINNDSALVFEGGTQVSKTGNVTGQFNVTPQKLHTFEIANVTAGLEDTRYGKVDTPHEFIFTGAMVTFTNAEIAQVEAGTSLPKTVDVWGGDCYVSQHLFKLTDTTYGLSNSEKFEGLGGLGIVNGVRNWEKSFNDLDTGGEANMNIPVPYANCAQYLSVVLESEYNAGVMDKEIISVRTLNNDDFPVYGLTTGSEQSCRAHLNYELNQNHRKTNSDKVFRIKDPLIDENNRFEARLIYSDQKVYQTKIQGFDVFKALNFYDLEEAYGPINALALAEDNLYSLQEKAVVYIGIGERVLETNDALQLSVQTGNYIGNVMYLATNRGSQHSRAVLEVNNAVYFVDNINKTVNRIAGKQLDILSEKDVATTFRELLSTELPEKDLITLYDTTHKQIWITSRSAISPFCYIYDEARSMWVSNYDFPANSLLGGAYTAQTLFLLGKNEGLNITSMYTGDYGQLFGTAVVPSVTSIVNPTHEMAKVFDAVLVPASKPLKAFDVIVNRPTDTQSVLDSDLNITTRGEGNYRVAMVRAASNARLRGLNASVKLKWHNSSDTDLLGNVGVKLPSFLTKYRISEDKF